MTENRRRFFDIFYCRMFFWLDLMLVPLHFKGVCVNRSVKFCISCGSVTDKCWASDGLGQPLLRILSALCGSRKYTKQRRWGWEGRGCLWATGNLTGWCASVSVSGMSFPVSGRREGVGGDCMWNWDFCSGVHMKKSQTAHLISI